MDKYDFYINKLKVHNFKSFQDLDVDLDRFNIVIGKNASGKTNFKNIFTFLIDAIYDGLPSAISIQGGHEQMLNFNSKDRSLSFEIHFLSDVPESIREIQRDSVHLKTTKIIYKFCIEFTQDMNYNITKDRLSIYVDSLGDSHTIARIFTISKNDRKITFSDNISDNTESTNEKQPNILKYFQKDAKELLIKDELLSQILPNWYTFIDRMATYDLDPRALKSPAKVEAFPVLKHDGSNLSYILNRIKNNSRENERLLNYIQSLLPFLKSFDTKYTNGKVEFYTKETRSDMNIPASFISDGTANIIGLLICMFFNFSSLSVIEEPEHSLHPGLLSEIIDLIDSAAELQQVIVTTHNPDVIEYVPIENVLLLDISNKGNSTITKLQDHELVNMFEDSMSLHELLRQDLLP